MEKGVDCSSFTMKSKQRDNWVELVGLIRMDLTVTETKGDVEKDNDVYLKILLQ